MSGINIYFPINSDAMRKDYLQHGCKPRRTGVLMRHRCKRGRDRVI
jgi:hypothetical protein